MFTLNNICQLGPTTIIIYLHTSKYVNLFLPRDESTKSEPTLVDRPVWLVHMNLSGLIFLPASAIAQLFWQ